jgi:hypothetical protein
MCVCRYESKFIESIVKEIADKLNFSLPHAPPSSLPLSSALRPPTYFLGLLREWRRSVFQTPSLFLFFLSFWDWGAKPKQKCGSIGTKHVDICRVMRTKGWKEWSHSPPTLWKDELIKGLDFDECFSLSLSLFDNLYLWIDPYDS